MAVRDGADQALAALTAAAHSGHVGGGPGLVDEDEPGRGLSPSWLARHPLTRGVHVRAHLFGSVGGFFKTDAVSVEQAPDRRNRCRGAVFTKPVADLRQGEVRRLGHQLPIAVPLKRRSPPCGRAATVPRCRQACASLTTKLGLTANMAATRRTLPPASTCRTTPSRRSIE
jgi:hypothetical protein